MKNLIGLLSSIFLFIRNPFFIALFLLTGTYQQAFEKQTNSLTMESDLRFIIKQSVKFNDQYADFIERRLDSLLARRRFNGSVLIAHEGHAVYNKSMGYSRYTPSTPFAQENNIFQLASVGKQFTAFAVLMLYERGLIDLDDEVYRHINGFPYPEITVRHLLNHTSGLQSYFYVIEHFWKQNYLPAHQDMLDLFVERSMPLNFTPGRRFSYSNTGYAFLAMLVESVTGQGFACFVKENIFQPLRMSDSFVYEPGLDLEELAERKNLSFGYERAGRRLREIPVDYLDGITGDKGIFSSTEDLLKWDNALENNLIVSEEIKAMAFDNGRLRSGYRLSYGFGLRLRTQQGLQTQYHNGWWRGFRTAYVRLPDNTLIVILNNTNASINGLDNQIRSIINENPHPRFDQKKIYDLAIVK